MKKRKISLLLILAILTVICSAGCKSSKSSNHADQNTSVEDNSSQNEKNSEEEKTSQNEENNEENNSEEKNSSIKETDTDENNAGDETNNANTEKSPEGDNSLTEDNPEPVDLDKAELAGIVNDILSQMTVEEKVGQLFVVNLELLDTRKGEDHSFTKVTATMREALKDVPVGGIVLKADNMTSVEQMQKMTGKLQSFSKIPLLIGTTEKMNVLSENTELGIEKYPSLKEIGSHDDESYAYQVSKEMAKDYKELGLNWMFEPNCNLLSETSSSENGFSDNPKWTGKLVKQMVNGLSEEQVAGVLKDFPGAPDGETDTEHFIDNNSTIVELRKKAFVPFKAGIKEGSDMILVSNDTLSEVTGEKTPCSMTELVLKDILRTEFAFDGVILTDALNETKITRKYTAAQASYNSIQAGADMVLLPSDLSKAYMSILRAVKTDKISEDLLNEKVSRILSLKVCHGIIPADYLS